MENGSRSNKTLVVVLRGVPGSGKSTLARELESSLGFTRISSDELGLKAWRAPLQEAVERGDKYIVLDRCHSTHNQRMHASRTLAPYKDKITTAITTLPELPFEELKRRIKADVGHTYGIETRLIALKSHSKDRHNDKISMAKEGWNHFIRLESNTLQELKEHLDGF